MNATALATKQGEDIDAIYNSDEERKRLQALMEAAYEAILKAVNAVVAHAFEGMVTLRLDDPATRRVLLEAGSRIVRIDEQTRQAIAAMLQRGQEQGYSAWQIAHGVEADGYPGIDGLFKETWRGRAEMVARTELQHAQLISAVDRYRATGLVDEVKLVDGEDDPVCAARNGKVVPLEQVPGLAHPNCTLSVIPIVREDVTQ